MLANWCAAVHRLDTDKEKAQYDQKIYHTGLYVFLAPTVGIEPTTN